MTYYKAAFEIDCVRVQALFDQVQERHLPTIQHPCLSLHEIVTLVQHPDCVAIVLVDNSILKTGGGDRDPSGPNVNEDLHVEQAEGEDVVGVETAAVYVGHYIVVTGVVAAHPSPPPADDFTTTGAPSYMFQVHNPALRIGPTLVEPELLGRARQSPGTDQDILFVVKRPQRPIADGGSFFDDPSAR